MQMSEKIDLLATALAKAQAEIVGAKKDSENPFFESKYADLAACWDACREPLSKNGLSVVQTTQRGEPVKIEWEVTEKGSGEIKKFAVDTVELVVTTLLLHESGQWIMSHLPMIPRDASPQGIGSALTYGRRYGFAAIVGVAQVDDDGNQASGRGTQKGIEHQRPVTKISDDVAMARATKMRGILERDEEEKLKTLHVLDEHDVINKDQDLYEAASSFLSASERAAWKAYVKAAKDAEKADRASSPNGRRF